MTLPPALRPTPWTAPRAIAFPNSGFVINAVDSSEAALRSRGAACLYANWSPQLLRMGGAVLGASPPAGWRLGWCYGAPFRTLRETLDDFFGFRSSPMF